MLVERYTISSDKRKRTVVRPRTHLVGDRADNLSFGVTIAGGCQEDDEFLPNGRHSHTSTTPLGEKKALRHFPASISGLAP